MEMAAVIVPASLVTAGVVLYTAIQAIVVGVLGYRRRLHLAFAATCLAAFGFQLSTIELLGATSVADGAAGLRWQFAFACLFMVASVPFIAWHTGLPRLRLPHWLLLASGLALLAVNLALPYGLRFTSLVEQPAGSVPRLLGTAGWGNLLARAVFTSMLGWALWRALLQYQAGERRAAGFLLASLLALLAASIWGALVDFQLIDSVYVAGFAYLAMPLSMSLSLGLDLRDRTRHLARTTAELRLEAERRGRSEQAIRHLAAGVSAETGELFFRRLVAELAGLFGARLAFVGMLEPGYSDRIRPLAVSPEGALDCNQSYPTADTPCARVIGQHTFVCTEGVAALFPDDRMLIEQGIQSYIGTPLFDSAGQPLGLIGVLDDERLPDAALAVDVLEIFAARAAAEIQRLRAEAQTRRMAYEDELTGLPNRAAFHRFVKAAVAEARLDGSQGAVLLVDLDHFKTINDALSHEVGDRVLRELAARLTRLAGDAVFVARLGGDEFVLVTGAAAGAEPPVEAMAMQLARQVTRELALPIGTREHVLSLGVSIGIAPFGPSSGTPFDILRQADLALYRAKNLGRGTVQCYEPPMQLAADQRLKLGEGLRVAIAREQLRLEYQPQFDQSGALVGAEALLRWRHPASGEISPALFIPIAEESGAIQAIGGWVLAQACTRLASWQRDGVPFQGRLAINVSPWQLARPDFAEQVRDALQQSGADPRRLTLEITETALLYDDHEIVERLQVLRRLGVLIALDDFGTGYSSLAYLKHLPLDELKIDRSFVQDLTLAPDHALLQIMLAVGRHLRLQVVAEGVETLEQQQLLAAMGCVRFQGWLLAKALPEAEFLDWLAACAQAPADPQRRLQAPDSLPTPG